VVPPFALDDVDASVVEADHVGRALRYPDDLVVEGLRGVLDGAAERDVGPPLALGGVAVHRADHPLTDDVHAEVVVALFVELDELLEERLPGADHGVDRVVGIELPGAAAVGADGRLVDDLLAEALAASVEGLARERQQRVRDRQPRLRERGAGRELVHRVIVAVGVFNIGRARSRVVASPSASAGCSSFESNSRLTRMSTSGSRRTSPSLMSTTVFSPRSHAVSNPRSSAALRMAFDSLELWRLRTPAVGSLLILEFRSVSGKS
jgi:hypothetical protein